MKKILITTAAAALMFAAGPSFAQDKSSNMYTMGEGESMMVMGGGSAEGSKVLMGENFASPADCPEGSYYMSGENQISACGEGGAAFDMMAPESGAMMEDGNAYPTGAMLMRPRESGESKGTESGGGG